ncbi:hypothetical protein Pla110_42480 [Polystyrenella longa]|uniref:Uncharacterized protein n=1 Tax=Polystyrenella longa TaxID=2528007 RepID=A0A518CTD3_9PLAN|nr:hypothetical protein [Polystyrenella longa]QDU82490.1 hypothetical protein Pla110_42480 [Polystyrenella longa]
MKFNINTQCGHGQICLVMFLMFILEGCHEPQSPSQINTVAETEPKNLLKTSIVGVLYDFECKDRTGSKLYGEHEIVCEWGQEILYCGGNTSFGSYSEPWPTEVTFKWMTHDKVPTGKVVSKKLPSVSLERWKNVYVVCILFLPEDKIAIKEFTKKEYDDKQAIPNFWSQNQPTYSVGVKNNTKQDITDLTLRFGKYYIFQETIAPLRAPNQSNPTGWKGKHYFPFPVTDTAVLSWTTAESKVHEKTIKMNETLPKDLNGQTLGFIINPDNSVKFQVKPSSEFQKWGNERYIWDKSK